VTPKWPRSAILHRAMSEQSSAPELVERVRKAVAAIDSREAFQAVGLEG
jgi:hypothetical protein